MPTEKVLNRKEALMDAPGLPCLAGGSGLLAFLVRLVQTGLWPGRVLDGRKVVCRTWGQAHHRVDAWIRRPSRSQRQRLRSHRRGHVGAVRVGLWWRMGLFCAGQLWQLTYQLWGRGKEKIGIMSRVIHAESPYQNWKSLFCAYLSIPKY